MTYYINVPNTKTRFPCLGKIELLKHMPVINVFPVTQQLCLRYFFKISIKALLSVYEIVVNRIVDLLSKRIVLYNRFKIHTKYSHRIQSKRDTRVPILINKDL